MPGCVMVLSHGLLSSVASTPIAGCSVRGPCFLTLCGLVLERESRYFSAGPARRAVDWLAEVVRWSGFSCNCREGFPVVLQPPLPYSEGDGQRWDRIAGTGAATGLPRLPEGSAVPISAAMAQPGGGGRDAAVGTCGVASHQLQPVLDCGGLSSRGTGETFLKVFSVGTGKVQVWSIAEMNFVFSTRNGGVGKGNFLGVCIYFLCIQTSAYCCLVVTKQQKYES